MPTSNRRGTVTVAVLPFCSIRTRRSQRTGSPALFVINSRTMRCVALQSAGYAEGRGTGCAFMKTWARAVDGNDAQQATTEAITSRRATRRGETRRAGCGRVLMATLSARGADRGARQGLQGRFAGGGGTRLVVGGIGIAHGRGGDRDDQRRRAGCYERPLERRDPGGGHRGGELLARDLGSGGREDREYLRVAHRRLPEVVHQNR